MSYNASSDQPIMRHVHPADRLRPWLGAAVGLVSLAGMLAFGILGRNFGTLDHLKLWVCPVSTDSLPLSYGTSSQSNLFVV